MSDQRWKPMQCFVSLEINSAADMDALEKCLRGWMLSPITRYFWAGQVASSPPPAPQDIPDTIKDDLLRLIDPLRDRLVVIFVDGQYSQSDNLLKPK